MSKERYTVETLSAGQPRPYADSIYLYRVTIEWQGMQGYKDKDAPWVTRPELSTSVVALILRGLCGGWHDEPGMFGRRLEYMKHLGDGMWEVKIVEPYDD